MKNSKMLTIIVSLLVAISLIGAAAVFAVMKVTGETQAKEPSIDEIIEASVDIPQITTNLKGDDFIRISFKIQTESKDAKEELEKRAFQVQNVIIHELSEKETQELQGSEGKQEFEEDLKAKLNEFMQDGQVVKVYITESLLQ